ncbi:MAG: hypothetical protein ACE5I1_11460 [bacterium]
MKKLFIQMLFLLPLMMLFLPAALFAQEKLPEIYNAFLNQTMIVHVFAVVGVVKLIRNSINVKGTWSITITVAASLLYGVFQYGFTAETWYYGVLIGGLAAGSFYLTKKTGKKVNPEGIK